VKTKDIKPGQRVRFGSVDALRAGNDGETIVAKVLRVGHMTEVPTNCGYEVKDVPGAPLRVLVQSRGRFGSMGYSRGRPARIWTTGKDYTEGKSIPLTEVLTTSASIMSIDEYEAKAAPVRALQAEMIAWQRKLASKRAEMDVVVAEHRLQLPPGSLMVDINRYDKKLRVQIRYRLQEEALGFLPPSKQKKLERLHAEYVELQAADPSKCER
jgi:hypothetical protein